MNDSVYDYVDDPTLAIGANGDVAVAWVDQGKKEVLFQLFDVNRKPRFEVPVSVSHSRRTFSWLPRIVLMGADSSKVAVLWQEIIFSGGSHGGEVLFARSSDGGQTFSQPINLSNSTAGDGKGRLTREGWDNGSLDLIAGPQGYLYAAWTEYEGALWVARSTDMGETFTKPLRVAGTHERPARGPSLAVAPGGKVHLAWTVGEDWSADIHWATSEDDGITFSEPKVAWESEGHSDAPKLAVDRGGNVHLVFAEGERGQGSRYRIYYARSLVGKGGFEEPEPMFESKDAMGVGRYPAIALDGNGRIYVIWESYREPRRPPRGLGFSLSADGGQTFAAPSMVPGTAGQGGAVNGGQQGLFMRKLSVSDQGVIGTVHSTFRQNVESHIWLIMTEVPPAGHRTVEQ